MNGFKYQQAFPPRLSVRPLLVSYSWFSRINGCIVLSALSACATLNARVPRPRSDSADASVYMAFLESSHGLTRGDTLYVTERSIAFHMRRPDLPSALDDADSLPSSLLADLEAASTQIRPTRALPLPYPTHILSDEEVKAIFQSDPVKGWNEFYRRFPTTRAYISFSPVVYTADRRHALFYLEYFCGSLCGEGLAVFVRRADTGKWTLHKPISIWIS
jgi:hypothetical protein